MNDQVKAPWLTGNKPAETKEESIDFSESGSAVVPEVSQGTSTPDKAIPEMIEQGEVFVTVVVKKPYRLTLDHEKVVSYKAGTQEMLLSHADHWFSKANGVEIYNPAREV